MQRAQHKVALSDHLAERQAAAAINLNQAYEQRENFNELQWRRVKMMGMFSGSINILLDNQVMGSVAGYFVYTPFLLDRQDVWVLVNRGWLPADGHRERVPDVLASAQLLTVSGSVKAPPKSGILLKEVLPEQPATGIYRVQKLMLDEVKELTGLNLLPYVVRMDSGSSAGFFTAWPVLDSEYKRHLAYAVQWFAMAATILFIYLILNIKRVKRF